MKVLSLFDTSICSTNLGDQIIMDAVSRILNEIFDDGLIVHFPTHEFIQNSSYQIIKKSKLSIIGGTNILSSNMPFYRQWKTGLKDLLHLSDMVLMGVGWWQYQSAPNIYTRYFYKNILSDKILHSVRDSYTESQLKSIGFTNVLNTSCPTTWELTEEHCREIPCKKADSVLLTFTEYRQNEKFDSKLLDLLLNEYKSIYFWTQQPNDYKYMQKLCGDRAIYLKPTLESLDKTFENESIDYVGTRLHAGIRALQWKKRTLILAVDNRAAEISKDINLPVISRDDISSIRQRINEDYPTKIDLPEKNIKLWKETVKEYWKSSQ